MTALHEVTKVTMPEPLPFGQHAARVGSGVSRGDRSSGGLQRILSNYGLVVFGVVLVMVYASSCRTRSYPARPFEP